MAATKNYPGWIKGRYPTQATAQADLEEHALYILKSANRIVGSVILRQQPDPAYHSVVWGANLACHEICVLFTFAVHPQYLGQGIGQAMLTFVAHYARANGFRALRLDVYEQNTPAVKLYEKCAFTYIDNVSLGLEAFGLNSFRLYEKLL